MQDQSARSLGGHVHAGERKRLRKARKIEAILAPRVDLSKAELLDLGAGSGLLSAYLAPRVKRLVAADRETQHFQPADIEIVATPTPDLPFDDASFDVVVYNHVIEHVGSRADQARALGQIARVLRPSGLLYIAAPNRWTVIEPHYGLPFLSWLPQRAADAWVRGTGRNDWYDCNPYSHPGIRRALAAAGFAVEDVTDEAFYRLLEIEKDGTATGRTLSRLPRPLVRAAAAAMPTFVMIARPRGG